ncbi:MAG: hypothetical protein PHS49_03115 [Candidatus Gracilibacteria bacterium]|nr:hypothetical protein [Candidatus Gracilibacteria bacterium]
MSNRLLGILIILGFIGAGYIYYQSIYLPNKQLEIQEQLVQQQLEQEQSQKKEIVLTKQEIDKIELTPEQKIQEIKTNKENYKTFGLENGSKAYFRESGNKLDLYYDDAIIGNFDLVYPEYLRVETVFGTINDLYIEVGPDKFYYNSEIKSNTKIDLNIDVMYVKKTNTSNLILLTTKGSFYYNISDKTLNYFSFFNDYVIFRDLYIGLVKTDEKRILTNLGFETDKNLIVYYNPDTKEKKILFETNLDISNMYLLNDQLFLKTIDGELYELENIE